MPREPFYIKEIGGTNAFLGRDLFIQAYLIYMTGERGAAGGQWSFMCWGWVM